MTTQQPEALRLAELLELAPEDGIEPQTAEDAAAGLRRLHSENESLQAGYAAARLEIESLQARIKTMAEEHADELMVAHLDGRMCGHSTEPAGAQQPAPPTAQAEGWRPPELEWDEVFDCAVAAYCRSSTSHDALRLCFQSRNQQHQISCGWTANELMDFARGIARLYSPPTSAEGVE